MAKSGSVDVRSSCGATGQLLHSNDDTIRALHQLFANEKQQEELRVGLNKVLALGREQIAQDKIRSDHELSSIRDGFTQEVTIIIVAALNTASNDFLINDREVFIDIITKATHFIPVAGDIISGVLDAGKHAVLEHRQFSKANKLLKLMGGTIGEDEDLIKTVFQEFIQNDDNAEHLKMSHMERPHKTFCDRAKSFFCVFAIEEEVQYIQHGPDRFENNQQRLGSLMADRFVENLYKLHDTDISQTGHEEKVAIMLAALTEAYETLESAGALVIDEKVDPKTVEDHQLIGKIEKTYPHLSSHISKHTERLQKLRENETTNDNTPPPLSVVNVDTPGDPTMTGHDVVSLGDSSDLGVESGVGHADFTH